MTAPFAAVRNKVARNLPGSRWRAPNMRLFCDGATAEACRAKTFAIFGVPRGGTTAVAGVVQTLGVPLGENLPSNLEDPDFATHQTLSRDVIASRNAARDVWGWKFPNATLYLEAAMADLRVPHFIVVTRDATANASAIARYQKNFTKERALREAAAITRRNLDFVMRHEKPTLFVSYEKLVVEPRKSVQEIADFLSVGSPAEAIEAAAQFVSPGRYRATWSWRHWLKDRGPPRPRAA